jgi:hypothetical protein
MCCKFTIFGRSVVIGGKKTYPSWDRHIDNVAAKGNRTLVFIRRNLRECIKQVRETSYLTILRPTLEYAAMVWDPTIQTLIQTLENVQRRTARLVINDYTSRTQGCVTSMLTSLWVADFKTTEEDKQTRYDIQDPASTRGHRPRLIPQTWWQQNQRST